MFPFILFYFNSNWFIWLKCTIEYSTRPKSHTNYLSFISLPQSKLICLRWFILWWQNDSSPLFDSSSFCQSFCSVSSWAFGYVKSDIPMNFNCHEEENEMSFFTANLIHSQCTLLTSIYRHKSKVFEVNIDSSLEALLDN